MQDSKSRVVALWVIVALNLLVGAYMFLLGVSGRGFLEEFILYAAFFPRFFTYSFFQLDGELLLHSLQSMVTYQFLHGDVVHLFFNMLFLVVFGRRVEKETGALKFTLFYLLCGVGGVLLHWLTNPLSLSPLVGASGAISGIMGCYVVAFVKGRSGRTPLGMILGGIGVLLVMRWLVDQVLATISVTAGLASSNVAYFAHLGGFALGLWLMYRFLRAQAPPLSD